MLIIAIYRRVSDKFLTNSRASRHVKADLREEWGLHQKKKKQLLSDCLYLSPIKKLLFADTSRKHAYIILTPLNPTFI